MNHEVLNKKHKTKMTKRAVCIHAQSQKPTKSSYGRTGRTHGVCVHTHMHGRSTKPCKVRGKRAKGRWVKPSPLKERWERKIKGKGDRERSEIE